MKTSLWAAASALSFSLMAAFVKLNSSLSAFELAFYRSFIIALVIAVFALSTGRSLMPNYIGGHVIRGVLGTISVCLWYYTLESLPLGTNITLTYTSPLFLSLFFIGYYYSHRIPVPWSLIGTIVLGFIGIVITLRPTFADGQQVPSLLCFTVAILDLIIYSQVRRLGRKGEPVWRIVFYFACFCSVFTFIAANIFENGLHLPPSIESTSFILGMALCGLGGLVFEARAWIGGNLLLVSCLGFTAIPISEILGIVLFDNNLSLITTLGMTIVAIACMIATVLTKRAEKAINSADF